MILTQESLREAGEALYGPSWQTPMADELQVAVRTVQRWASGEREIPDWLAGSLAKLCVQRGRALERLAGKLAKA